MVASCGDGGTSETPNSAPTQIFLSVSTVSEQVPLDTVVGTLTVSDPDVGDTHTFELLNNTDKFAVVSNELRTAGELDFETRPTYEVGIRATDSGGLTHDELVNIDLIDVVEVSNNDDDGVGSLRQLLESEPAGSTIFVDSSVSGTIILTSGVITVTQPLTLVGPGSSVLTVSGADAQPILVIEETGQLTLSGLTLTNSRGSAIRNTGGLTLTDAVVRDSDSPGTGRGACLSSSGPLSVARVTFSGCSAFNAGAADVVDGVATFDAVTFTGNSTTGNSGAAMIASSPQDVTVTNSTFSGNFVTGADRVGGAIGVFGDAQGNLILRHNTFFGNTATGDGGAIYMAAETSVEIEGNLFAGNAALNAPDISVDALATLTSQGFNLLEDGTGSGLVDGENNDIVGQAAMVAPLVNNGGPTETHALNPGSPAIDAIPPADCSVTTDQRGEPRPVGSGCDIGSVEQ